MSHSLSTTEENGGASLQQRRVVLDPTLIAESSSRILQQSRQVLASESNNNLLTSSSTRPQLFDANGRPTHLPSRASYKYHNGKLSVKKQRTRTATQTRPSLAPTNSELLALARSDESDTDADGEEDWEVCDHDFTTSPPLQLSTGRRTELTGVRKSIPLLASLSVSRKVSPPTAPSPRHPDILGPPRAPEPQESPITTKVTAPTPEAQAPIPSAPVPTILPTQESELTELSESEGLLYDYPLVPQRQAAALAEARVSVQVKREVIKRVAPEVSTPYGQKGRFARRSNWTLEEEIDLVRFIFETAAEFDWDKKAEKLPKRLPKGRSVDEVKARWATLLSYLNSPSVLPGSGDASMWSVDEDEKIFSIVIDYIPTYGRALLFGKEKANGTRSASAFGSKWLKLKTRGVAAWVREVTGESCEEPHVDITNPTAPLKPEDDLNASSEVRSVKKEAITAKRKRVAAEDEDGEAKAVKKTLRSDDVVKWTAPEDKQLLQAVAKYAQVDWNLVRAELSGSQSPPSTKTPQVLERRWTVLKSDLTSVSVGKQRASG